MLSAREAAALASEGALLTREQSMALREKNIFVREQALQEQERAFRAKVDRGALTEAQLREANERLVIAAMRAQTMVDAADIAARQLSHMASHDILTALPNRAVLTDRFAQSIANAQRHDKKVAVLYLDLDNFKHINDSLGHGVGDQLLQAAARRLHENVRQSDTVCRHGGDEFIVLLSEVDTADDAELAARKLISAMAEPYIIDRHRLHVTVSIGISLYPDDGNDAESIFRNADTAMYNAKRNGRNHCQLFTTDMNVRAVMRQSVEVTLRQALEENGFVLHYQPKVDLRTGAITGAEALLRLARPGLPLMVPTQFVGIAEDIGLIVPIGRWVMGEACRQAAVWLRAGMAVGQIAVNVSAVEFHGKGFLAGVRTILDASGLDPHHLEFELTESGLLQDSQPTRAILHALKDLGVQIAIDDFGTGYSSLNYLRRFPIDTLKIDQSFIRDIDGPASATALVSAIIAMGRCLNLRVIAEGIETPRQLEHLQTQACTEGQGYYFSHPIIGADFAALLEAGRPLPPH